MIPINLRENKNLLAGLWIVHTPKKGANKVRYSLTYYINKQQIPVHLQNNKRLSVQNSGRFQYSAKLYVCKDDSPFLKNKNLILLNTVLPLIVNSYNNYNKMYETCLNLTSINPSKQLFTCYCQTVFLRVFSC